MTKPKLLLISGISPFPQTSGGATRIKQTLLHLSEKYEIYFYFFVEKIDQLKEQEKIFLNKHTSFFQPIILSSKSIIVSLQNSIPYHFSNYFSKELIGELSCIQNKIKFDQIRVESTQILYLSKYLQLSKSSKFVSLDVSTISFWRRAFETKNPLKFFIKMFGCLQVYLYENKLLNSFAKVLVMSDKDEFFMRKIFHLQNISISPNGVEKIKFLNNRNNSKTLIGFIGSIEHSPNKKAIDYLLNNILPLLKVCDADFDVIILSKDICRLYKSTDGVYLLDHLDNLEDFYSKIDILVAPIFSGSGTRLKILESLSYGKPVITTEVGAEGLEIQSKFLTILPKYSQFFAENWIKNIISISKSKNELKNSFKDLEKQLSRLTWEKIFSEE